MTVVAVVGDIWSLNNKTMMNRQLKAKFKKKYLYFRHTILVLKKCAFHVNS